MAIVDKKISEFTPATTLSDTSQAFIPVVDETKTAESDKNVKMTVDNFKTAQNILEVPSGGTQGQIIIKGSSDYAWGDLPAGGMSANEKANQNNLMKDVARLNYENSLEAIAYQGGFYDIFADESKIDSTSQVDVLTLDNADVDGKVQLGINGDWDLSSASYDSVTFNVGANDTSAYHVVFSADGTRMYMLGATNDAIYMYILSTAWDISTAVLDGPFFSVSSEDNNPQRIFFKPDGTKIFMIGNSTDYVYSYSLTTPWNIHTASYDVKSYYIENEDNTPSGLAFSSDGTKMYIIGLQTDKLHSYSLSTAWDISTASYDNVSFNLASQDTVPYSFYFKPDGTKFYIAGASNDRIYAYSLSTAWDISTASYDSVSFDNSGQETTVTGLVFKPNGTKMYLLGNNNLVYQYSLDTGTQYTSGNFESTSIDLTSDLASNPTKVVVSAQGDYGAVAADPYRLDLASYDSVSFSVSSQSAYSTDIQFSSDGTKMYMLASVGATVYSYTLSTAWDLSTASYDSISFSIGQDSSPRAFAFKSDGTKMYVYGFTNKSIYQYTLSTAWDLSTASYDSVSYYIVSYEIQGMFFKPDGTKMFIINDAGNRVYSFNLSTAWLISSLSYNNTYSVNSQETNPQSLFFKPDGTKMYIIGYNTDTVYQYSLSEAWNEATANYDQVSFNISSQETFPYSLVFSSNGDKMYILGGTNTTVYQYTIERPAYTTTLSVTISDGTNDVTVTSANFDTEIDCSSLTSRTLTVTWDLSTTNVVGTPIIKNYALYFTA